MKNEKARFGFEKPLQPHKIGEKITGGEERGNTDLGKIRRRKILLKLEEKLFGND